MFCALDSRDSPTDETTLYEYETNKTDSEFVSWRHLSASNSSAESDEEEGSVSLEDLADWGSSFQNLAELFDITVSL